MFARLRSFVRMLVHRDRFERSMDDEMRFHLDAYADDLARSGVSRDEAMRRARLEFGPQQALRDECRESRGIRLLDELRQDLRYAGRQFKRAPAFTAAAVISLALGIGANGAIFGLLDAVVFRTLPVESPSTLYFLAHGSGDDVSTSSNYPLLARYQSSNLFESVTSSTQRAFTVDSPEGPERIEGEFVSGNYHATLGVRLVLGHGFASEPDRPDGRAPIAVISDEYWTRRFARRPNVVGQTLLIDGRIVTIVGVTEPGFHGLVPGMRTDITMPLYVRAMENAAFFEQRDRWISVRIVGRMRADRTELQTRAGVDALFRRFWTEPENGRRPGDERAGALIPAGKGSTGLRDRYSTPLWLLFAMVGVVLLIACANVSNLLLARGVSRSREVAVRLSLGAGRARLVRQLLTESSILALFGATLGLAIASTSIRIIANAFATGERPLLIDAGLTWRVLAFIAGTVVTCVLLVGLVPALRSSRVDVAPTLKEGTVRTRTSLWSLGRILVATQLALSFMLVTGATLLARSILNMRTMDTGFTQERTLLFNVEAGDRTLTPESRAVFFRHLDQRLRALPGVDKVALIQRTPLDRSTQTRPIEIPGITITRESGGVSANVVTPEFFDMFGIRVVRGRAFTADDRAGTEPVALVDETFVRRYFGSTSPLGRRLFLGADREPFTIVGVVTSARVEDLREDPSRTIYTVLAQSRLGSGEQAGDVRRITVAVHTTNDPGLLATSLRSITTELSRRVIVSYVRTMEQQFDAALLRERLMASLSVGYGVLALLLSLVGLYGITSFGIMQRTRDIGIRMALGASGKRVLASILGETLTTSALGIVLGGVGALLSANLLSEFVFGVQPRDPVTFAAVVVLLTGTALLACLVPARRAATIDPVRSLRSD